MKKTILISVLAFLLLSASALNAFSVSFASSKNALDEDEAWKAEIEDELWAIMDEMTEEETTPVTMVAINHPTDEEIDEKVVEETGWARAMFIEMSYVGVLNQEYRDQYNNVFLPAIITKTEEALGLAPGTLNPESPQVLETITAEREKVYDCFTETRAEMFNEFYANIQAVYGIETLYLQTYSGKVGVDATKAEIEFYAKSEDFSVLQDGSWMFELQIPEYPDYGDEISEDPSSEDEAWRRKLDEETLQMLDAMSDDDLMEVWCFRKGLDVPVEEKFKEITGFSYSGISSDGSEEQQLFLASFLSAKEEELGLEPGSLDEDSLEGKSAISEAWSYASSVRRSIIREAYTNFNQEFVDKLIDPSRTILYFSNYTSTLILEASKAEIIIMARDDTTTDIHYYVEEEVFPEVEDSFDDFGSEDISADDYSSEYVSDVEISDDYSSDDVSDVESADEPSSESDTTEIVMGDVNADGTVNSLDGAQVLKYDAELITLEGEGLAAADVNSDGTVNSLDAAQILKYDAKLITEF